MLHLSVCLFFPGPLDPSLSLLLWVCVLGSLGFVLLLPSPNAVRILVISSVLRLGFSLGLQHMLSLLGAFNVRPHTLTNTHCPHIIVTCTLTMMTVCWCIKPLEVKSFYCHVAVHLFYNTQYFAIQNDYLH